MRLRVAVPMAVRRAGAPKRMARKAKMGRATRRINMGKRVRLRGNPFPQGEYSELGAGGKGQNRGNGGKCGLGEVGRGILVSRLMVKSVPSAGAEPEIPHWFT